MDPVTIGAVLAAIAGGAGGTLGTQLWTGVCALVRRPFRRGRPAGDPASGSASGVAELAALEQAPADQARATALAEVLVARAAADREFGEALAVWCAQASKLDVGGDVANTIQDGTFHGPVLLGRDFTGLTFGSPAAAPPAQPGPESGT